MELRDKFAMQAMTSLIAKMPPIVSDGVDDEAIMAIFTAVAQGAYCYADAMLDVREGY